MEQEIWAGGNLTLLKTDEENPEVRKDIPKQIKAFNDAISEAHRTARKPGIVRPLHVLLRDHNGRLLGGLIADTN